MLAREGERYRKSYCGPEFIMTNPFTPILDQLQKQAEMRFNPADVSRVHRICLEVTRSEDIRVDVPLPAWDSMAMGVAFRQVRKQNIKGEIRTYKRTASFVLEAHELTNEGQIRAKATVACAAILQTVLCQIREVREVKEVSNGPVAASGER